MTTNNGQPQELTPRNLILMAQYIMNYVLRKWYMILAIGVVAGLAAALYYKYTKDDVFIAEITFVIDEEITKQKKSGFSEITEQLGLGPSDAGSLFSSESNIAALLMSRMLTEQTLLSQVPSDKNKKILFVDFFLDSLPYRDKWFKEPAIRNINFSVPPQTPQEELTRNRIIGKIHKHISGRQIKIEKKLKGSNILAATCTSEHELYSKLFLEALIANVTTYYVNAQTKKARANLEAIKRRTDSVRNAYGGSLYQKATAGDANINPVREVAVVPAYKKQTDAEILKSAYTELALSLESAKTSLMQTTPFIQVLDSPVLPLAVNKVSIIKKFIIFFSAGAVLFSCIIAASALYKMIMTD
jgi:hypothetical protein